MDDIKHFKSYYDQWICLNFVWFCFVVPAFTTQGMIQDQYVGCFYDNITQLTPGPDMVRKDMTIKLCVEKCRNHSTRQAQTTLMYIYAKLQNGTDCYCANDYGIQLSDDACNITCSGRFCEYCGGTINERLSVYSLYTVCPVGNYGSVCEKVCHCKGQIPCDRKTGKCPNGCDGNYVGLSCNTTPVSEQYINCYKDKAEDRAMYQVVRYEEQKNTLEMCLTSCANRNYTFAGLQYSSECFCGETYNKHGRAIEGKCQMTCSGNRQQICGGSLAISVYRVCPAGSYGKGCIGKCNCIEGGCVYENGICIESQCKPGWHGEICNLRDCRIDNGDCDKNEICLDVDLRYSKISMCRCSQGFQRNKTWEKCYDVDECSENPEICGPFANSCNNTKGSYICVCRNGKIVQNGPCESDTDDTSGIMALMKLFYVETLVGSWCFFAAVLGVIVIVHLYRRKRQSSSSSHSTNITKINQSSSSRITSEVQQKVRSSIPEESTYTELLKLSTCDAAFVHVNLGDETYSSI